jgi:predicted metal-dependent peptidase
MKDTTSNNLPSADLEVSQEQLDDFKLSKHLVDLLWNEPFYSCILRSLTKIETEQIPTAGVLAKDGNITMWWNRRFLASLKAKQVKGLLKHECLHLVYQHTTTRKKTPHIIWNYATDLAINSTIPYEELPEGGLVPGYKLPPLKQEVINKMSNEQLKTHTKLEELIYNLPSDKTSEFYFEKLMEDGDLAEQLQQEGNCSSSGIGFDDHEGWDELSDAEREMIGQKIQEVLKGAVNEANCKGWGSVSAQKASELNKMISRNINWEDILKTFCGYTSRDERQSSNKRLNRKYPFIHPGSKKIYKPRIAIYVDESGSMSSEYLEMIYSELKSLSKKTDFYLYKFDAEVADKDGFLWKKGKRLKINRSLTGGTCFNSVTKHALKNKKKFDGYIIFTDGEASKPKSSVGLKRAWLLYPSAELVFEKDRADTLITMKC